PAHPPRRPVDGRPPALPVARVDDPAPASGRLRWLARVRDHPRLARPQPRRPRHPCPHDRFDPLLRGRLAGRHAHRPHRRLPRRNAAAEELIAEIGTSCHAVLVCALTTVMGCGSLVFMAIPAVRSLGVAVSLGVLSSLAATVLYLAPLLIRENRRVASAAPQA